MSERRVESILRAMLVATLVLGAPRLVSATQKFGPLQLSGNLQSQNLIRTPDAGTFEFVQNRNTAHIQLEYKWLEAGKFYSKYEIPFIETSNLFLKWRGVYDSVYDTTPGFFMKEDIHGTAYAGQDLYGFAKARGGTSFPGFAKNTLSLSGLTHEERNALKFDNQLREFYADIKFRTIPLNVRAGRQQIVWGETDNFRMLDRANTLDLTWHLQQEVPAPAFGWDEIRRPFWMIKFLYDLGDIWKLSQNFLEWYWNPGDWRPAKQSFFPRPWGLPFLNPLTNPVDGAFIGGICEKSRTHVTSGINEGAGECLRLLNGTKLFDKGDYARNPMENSQVGVRYHGILPQGLEFSLVYFYQRWGGDDGTNYAPIAGLPATPANQNRAIILEQHGTFPAEAIFPYVHSIGASANYSDETFTQTVFRFETIFDSGIPFFDVAKKTVVNPTPLLPGITKKNMWKGMIAFDRPTWIRTLNKKSTVFLTGQFFWHYVINNPSCEPQVIANQVNKSVKSCLAGGLDLPSSQRPGTVSAPDSPAFRDKIRNWETLFTLAGFTFYRGGSIVPVLGIAVDPTNQFSMEPFWVVDYVVRDDFVVNLGQRYFVAPRGYHSPIFETWGLAGLNRGRSETSVRLTYQF